MTESTKNGVNLTDFESCYTVRCYVDSLQFHQKGHSCLQTITRLPGNIRGLRTSADVNMPLDTPKTSKDKLHIC
jgi:hypothetical protein